MINDHRYANFFRPDASLRYHEDAFFEKERQGIQDLGGEFLTIEQANQFPILKLFDFVNRGTVTSAIPKTDKNINIPIPEDPDDYEEIMLGKEGLATILERHINETFTKQKYMFSTDPKSFRAVAFEAFSYDLYRFFNECFMTTPILIFDEEVNKGFVLNSDVYLGFYVRLSEVADQFLLDGKPDQFWIDYFNDNLAESVPPSHADVINKYFIPFLEGAKPLIIE